MFSFLFAINKTYLILTAYCSQTEVQRSLGYCLQYPLPRKKTYQKKSGLEHAQKTKEVGSLRAVHDFINQPPFLPVACPQHTASARKLVVFSARKQHFQTKKSCFLARLWSGCWLRAGFQFFAKGPTLRCENQTVLTSCVHIGASKQDPCR